MVAINFVSTHTIFQNGILQREGNCMNTDWLYSFVAVAETGSFTEAAYAMYQSQSVISKHIQKLEQELQVQLFHRDHRQAVLTASGTAILPEARRILRQLERLKEAAHPEAHLRISLLPVADSYSFTERLSGFSALHKETVLILEEHSNASIHDLLRSSHTDGAFYRLNIDEIVPPHSLVYCQEDLVLLVHKDLFPGRTTPVDLAELENEHFILLDKSTCLYDISLELCHQAGFHPHIIYTGSSGSNIARLVEKQQGIAILARHAAEGISASSTQILSIASDLRSTLVFTPSEAGLKQPGMAQLMAYVQKSSSTFL